MNQKLRWDYRQALYLPKAEQSEYRYALTK